MEILAHIIAYMIFACLILAGLALVVGIINFFYYRMWRSNSVKVYYDDNDHRKGYYIVKRPSGPYPVGYPREQIVNDMEAFERLKREQKAKNRGRKYEEPGYISSKSRPLWLQILLMTPAEYIKYRKQRKELKNNRNNFGSKA